MLSKINEVLKPFKKLIIVGIILILVLIVVKAVLPTVSEIRANKTPIKNIEAINNRTYSSDSEIKATDFTVKATHEDGKTNTLDASDYELSQTGVNPVGEETKVTVSLVSDSSIKCTAKVKTKREKVVGFECGYPKASSVKAVLYSNGELCFEGEGDVMVFDEGAYPWLNYDNMDDNPIKSVSFQKGVTPSNMNYWFKGMTTLTYVDSIPTSVKSMIGTFSGCIAMEKGADWSKCDELLNINDSYNGCVSITYVPAVPKKVKTATSAFAGCESMKTSPDLTGAESLANAKGMFSGCKKMNSITMGPSIENAESMYSDCINLKNMPTFPGTVKTLNSAFKGDVSLVTLTEIPAFVEDTSGMLSGCEMIEGDLVVKGNPKESSSMFEGAALATKVNLTGDCQELDVLANTSDTGNVYVNNNIPNENITSYADVFGTN